MRITVDENESDINWHNQKTKNKFQRIFYERTNICIHNNEWIDWQEGDEEQERFLGSKILRHGLGNCESRRRITPSSKKSGLMSLNNSGVREKWLNSIPESGSHKHELLKKEQKNQQIKT